MAWDTEVTSLSPTFRWQFNGTTTESVASLATTTVGTINYTTSLIPSEPSRQSILLSGNEINPANDPLINAGTGYTFTQRSLAMWVNATDLRTSPLWEQGGSTNWFALFWRNGDLQAIVGEASAPQGFVNYSINTAQTYFVVVTVDLTAGSNNLKLYVDGILRGQVSTTAGADLAEHSGDVTIAGDSDAPDSTNSTAGFTRFLGAMQEVLYWNERVLTPQEIQDLYTEGGGTLPAPTFTNNPNTSIASGQALSKPLTTDLPATFTIQGGVDSAEFEIFNGDNLRWVSNGTRDFGSPQDTGADNVYDVTIRATGVGGTTDQNIQITVVESSQASTVERGLWTGGVLGSFLPGTTTWTALANAVVGQNEIVNTNSVYSWDPLTATLTLPATGLANGYLIVGEFHWRLTHNNRANLQGRWQQTSGSGNFVFQPTGGYGRNNNNDEVFVRTVAFIDAPVGSETFQLQWKRDNGTGGVAGGLQQTAIEVIPLWYNNIGMYNSTGTGAPGGTTPAAVTGFGTVVETDSASISRTGNDITVAGDNTRYLIIGGSYWEGIGGRTQRWHGITINGTWIYACQAYSYYRDGNNDEVGEFFAYLHETGTADDVIVNSSYRGDGVAPTTLGGADVSGSETPAVGQHMTVVLELTPETEVFRSTSTATQQLTINNTETNAAQSVEIVDTNSWGGSTDQRIDSVLGGEALLFGITSGSYNTGSGTRYTGATRFAIDGTVQGYTLSGDYGRGNQGTTDTYGWGTSMASAVTLTAGQDVSMVWQDFGDTAVVSKRAGWTSFAGINLDTMIPATGSPGIYIGPQTADAIEIGPGTFADKYLGLL